MKLNTTLHYDIESVNAELVSIGCDDIHIFDDPREDGRITMIFDGRTIFGDEYPVICLTDCMNAREWMERFTEGRWFGIVPLPRGWSHPGAQTPAPEERHA
jgi:hypothetical protein